MREIFSNNTRNVDQINSERSNRLEKNIAIDDAIKLSVIFQGYLKNKMNKKGKVVVIEGIRGVKNADLRRDGFISEITRESEITVVASETANWHSDEAFIILAKG